MVFMLLGDSFMKKKKIANFIMILVIAAIAVSGIAAALYLRTVGEDGFGSLYQITPIPDNTLTTSGNPVNLCTITIRCDTILDNKNNLKEEKAPYVPTDGEILPVTTVEFTPGETVFGVLNRVCGAADIQIEYSWTPLYDSYYIEGINHLYEFDCGSQSGWMYKVNDWFPNYGCSAYKVENGDSIVWCYTCNGLGEDVGSTWMPEETVK